MRGQMKMVKMGMQKVTAAAKFPNTVSAVIDYIEQRMEIKRVFDRK